MPVIAAVLLALLLSAPALGESADPAASRVNGFYEVLLSTMQQGKQLGLKGRYDKLAPVLSKTYDLASMAKTAVGPSWSEFTPEQQREIVKAFIRTTIATYASRFDDFSCEQFDVAQNGRPAEWGQDRQDAHRSIQRQDGGAQLSDA